MKEKEGIGTIAYFAKVSEVGLLDRFRSAHTDIFRFVYNNVHNRGMSHQQVSLVKKGIKDVLDANKICAEIEDYRSRGGYRFIKCMGVKITLHPYYECALK